jgi:hypothetical protein
VLCFHREPGDLFAAQTVAAPMPRILRDLGAESGGDGRCAHGAISLLTSSPRLCNSASAVARTIMDLS